SSFLPCCCHKRARLIAARSSSDFACCFRAISMAFWKIPLEKKRGIGETGNRRGFFSLRFSPSPLLRFGALALRQADIAPPRSNAPQSCLSQSVLRRVWPAHPLPALLSHTPRPAGQDYRILIDLPPWLGGWPGLGGAG